jgi:Pyridoxal-phosphate dependent enzyme
MASRLTTDAVRAARQAIGDRLHTTPLLTSARTSERVGAEVLLKAELFQRTGSFKPRGVYAKLLQLTAQERKRGVVAASSGNHAQALAYGANALDIDCLAVMWPGASAQKIAAVRNYGAAVDLDSSNGTEAEHHATTIADRTGRILIPAYDDDAVMAGQGTLALELIEQIPDPHAILVPVSGAASSPESQPPSRRPSRRRASSPSSPRTRLHSRPHCAPAIPSPEPAIPSPTDYKHQRSANVACRSSSPWSTKSSPSPRKRSPTAHAGSAPRRSSRANQPARRPSRPSLPTASSSKRAFA